MATRTPSFAEAFRFWLKLGFISFGGPAGQIAILHKECVERRQWLSEDRFLHALNYCMLLPGPEAQQLATYIGWLLHGVKGGLAAGGLFVLPSAFILAGLSYLYVTYGKTTAALGVLTGFKAVVVAIVLQALIKIARRALKHWSHVVIAAAAFAGLYFARLPFPAIVFAAAVLGWLGARLWPLAPDAPTAEPVTLPSARGTFRTIAIGIVLWMAPFALLLAWRGATSLHVAEYRFFSQAALITFGGAYAVLAYITQSVTQGDAAWLTPAQSIDGLALAETTPGPLIMVLQFIGFVAAWQQPQGMSPLGAALLGAAITTYTTFLPSFLFIFAGAPYIEAVRGNRHLAGALAAITAAVVGVILNLALVFGQSVLWLAGPQLSALLLTAAAFVALQLGVEVFWVVLAGGLAGWLLN